MDFYQDLDSIDLIENHAQEVLQLEMEQSEKILASYSRIAKVLHARLSKLPKESFTAQRTRVVLIQLEGAIQALNEKLNASIADGASSMAQKGLDDLATEYDAMSAHFLGTAQPINLDAVEMATDFSQRLINQYEVSIRTYSEDIRNKISIGLQDAVIAGDGPEKIIDQMGNFFLGEQWRLRRIVRTELQGIYSGAKLDGLGGVQEKYAPDMMKTLYHPVDARTGDDSLYCMKIQNRGLEGQTATEALIVPIHDYFRYTWKGKPRRYMFPPDRPNDRSILIPWRQSWS